MIRIHVVDVIKLCILKSSLSLSSAHLPSRTRGLHIQLSFSNPYASILRRMIPPESIRSEAV